MKASVILGPPKKVLIGYAISIFFAAWVGFLVSIICIDVDPLKYMGIEMPPIIPQYIAIITNYLILGGIVGIPLMVISYFNRMLLLKSNKKGDTLSYLQFVLHTNGGFYVGLLSFIWVPMLVFLWVLPAIAIIIVLPFMAYNLFKSIPFLKNNNVKTVIIRVIFSIFVGLIGVSIGWFFITNFSIACIIVCSIATVIFTIVSPRIVL